MPARPRGAGCRGRPVEVTGRSGFGRVGSTMAGTPDDAITTEPPAPRGTAGGPARGVPPRGPPGDQDTRPRRAPVPLAVAVTTIWATVVTLTPVVGAVLVLHAFDGDGGAPAGSLLRAGVAGWLLAHGVPVRTGLGRIGLAPLAISGLAAWRLVRAGVHTTRAVGGRRSRSVRLAVPAALGAGLAYGLLGATAAGLVNAPGSGVSPVRAGVTLAVFGLVAAGAGVLRETGLVD